MDERPKSPFAILTTRVGQEITKAVTAWQIERYRTGGGRRFA
jgi:hypothetical protein